jgi:hypothetical protein
LAISLLNAALSGTLLAAPLESQVLSQRIAYQESCLTCSIILEPVVTLGKERDPILAAGQNSLATDTRGRFYAMEYDRKRIAIFDSTGRFLQSIGRDGDGPGEVGRGIARFQTFADSLFVFTIASGRMIVFGPSLQVVRTVQLPRTPATSAAVLANGNVVIDGHIGTAESIGFQYHVFDSAGKLVKSFGSGSQEVVPRGPVSASQPRSLAGTSAFTLDHSRVALWTWASFEYRAARWSVPTFVRTNQVTVVDVPWLPNPPPVVQSAATMRDELMGRAALTPAPLTSTLISHVDSENRFWVVGIIPLRMGHRSQGRLSGCNSPELSSRPGWMGCRLLEVIDIKAGKLLVSRLIDPGLNPIPGSNLFVLSEPNSLQITRLRVFRAKLIDVSP